MNEQKKLTIKDKLGLLASLGVLFCPCSGMIWMVTFVGCPMSKYVWPQEIQWIEPSSRNYPGDYCFVKMDGEKDYIHTERPFDHITFKNDIESNQSPHIESDLKRFGTHYVIHIPKRVNIERVMFHEPGVYSVVFKNKDNIVLSGKVYSPTVVADVPEGEPSYLESEIKEIQFHYILHLHDTKELEGGEWREHRHKQSDRVGQTKPVE